MPDISKIKLPGSNQVYDLKDAVAREAISGGVTFIVAWDGASTPVVADIPYGVKVTYNNVEYTGTLSAETTGSGTHAQPGAFYLVKSGTTPTGETKDIYDEYVPVGTTGSKYWEKLGDTQIDLSDVVTGVSLSKDTDSVIGADSTFTITQPTVTISTDTTGDTDVLTAGTTKYMKATATGANTAWNSKDSVTAVTGYASPTTASAASSVSPTTKKLETTSITGTNGTETVPNVTAAGSASTWSFAMGTGTGETETLIISGSNSTAPTLGTAFTVAKAASSATTVATGETVDSDSNGDNVVTNVSVGDTISAITALGTPTTDTVIGADSTFTITQPTVTLSNDGVSGTNVAYVESVTKKKAKATATGANTAWNSKDAVTALTSNTDVSVTKGQ